MTEDPAAACSAGHLRPAVEVAVAGLVWAGAYRLAGRCWPGRQPEWRCRLVTAGHACLVSGLAIYDVLGVGRNAAYHAYHGLPYNQLERVTFTVCLGYFIFDLLWCLTHRTEGPVMLFHHCASIFGLGMSLFNCRWAPELIATIGGTEISNPLLQLRWFLRNSGDGNSQWLLAVVELAFLLLFCVMRLGVGGILVVSYFSNPRTDFIGRLGAFTMFGIGLVFFAQICSYCLWRFHGKASKKSASNGLSNGVGGTTARLRKDS